MFRVISSHRNDLVLRAESKEGMNDWLFGFHRALASIIVRVIENKQGGGAGEVEAGRRGGGGAGGGEDGGGECVWPCPRVCMSCEGCLESESMSCQACLGGIDARKVVAVAA